MFNDVINWSLDCGSGTARPRDGRLVNGSEVSMSISKLGVPKFPKLSSRSLSGVLGAGVGCLLWFGIIDPDCVRTTPLGWFRDNSRFVGDIGEDGRSKSLKI
jgi:hypothetical protein